MLSISTNKIKNDIIAKILFKSLHPKRNEPSESAIGGKNNEQPVICWRKYVTCALSLPIVEVSCQSGKGYNFDAI